MRLLAALLPCLALLTAGPSAAEPVTNQSTARSGRPNVVFIIADDMNGYGFYNEFPGVIMPHLEAFRKSAITFRHAYCAAPSCVPSRAAFFSGQLPSTTGSYLNGSDPWDKPAMEAVESLPEVFKRGGYTTWGAGKLFHARITPARETKAFDNKPKAGGFGPYLSEADQLAVKGGDGGKWWGAGPWTGPDADFPDVTNSTDAIAFLNQKHDKPFFLVLGLWRPHTPFTAPQRFFALYDEKSLPMPPAGWTANDLDDVPAAGRKLAQVWGERWEQTGADHPDLWRRIIWGYLACNSFADWSTGRVIDALDASAYAGNTLVVFIGDNGYHCGEKNHFEKSTLWEAAAQVPLAIRLPGRTQAGTEAAPPVSLVDLFPTLLDYCQLAPPRQPLDGRSLRPLLDNPAGAWDHPAVTLYEEHYFSACDDRYRYIQYPDGTEELYDHTADPHELTNIAARADTAPIKQRLQKQVPATWARSLGGRAG